MPHPVGFGSWSTLKLASALDGCDSEFSRSGSNETGVGVEVPQKSEALWSWPLWLGNVAGPLKPTLTHMNYSAGHSVAYMVQAYTWRSIIEMRPLASCHSRSVKVNESGMC